MVVVIEREVSAEKWIMIAVCNQGTKGRLQVGSKESFGSAGQAGLCGEQIQAFVSGWQWKVDRHLS